MVLPPDAVVVVFGATGTQGRAQVRQLLAQGFRPRAACRRPLALPLEAQECAIPCDFKDVGSISAAVRGAHAIFLTPPHYNDANLELCRIVANAAAAAGVHRIVLNTSLPARPSPNLGDRWEREVASSGVPCTFVRPGPYMENLLFPFVLEGIGKRGLVEYVHKPGGRKSWVCADDVAAVMVASLRVSAAASPVGVKLEVGGPEAVTPEEVAAAVGKAVGGKVGYTMLSYPEFGRLLYNDFGKELPVSEPVFSSRLEKMYRYWNESPEQSMKIDVAPLLALLPELRLTSIEEWAQRQRWPPSPASSKL